MHKTEGANATAVNEFIDGPPGTTIEEDWLNAVQAELVYVIEQAGLTLKTASTETGQQLLAALLGDTGTGLTFGKIGIGIAPGSMTASGLEILDKGGDQIIIEETGDTQIDVVFNSDRAVENNPIFRLEAQCDGNVVARIVAMRGDDDTSGKIGFEVGDSGAPTQVVMIEENGDIGLSATPTNRLTVRDPVAQGTDISSFDNAAFVALRITSVSSEGGNAANTAIKVGKDTATNRSINSGGTNNASGADYAEYETKRDDCGIIAKGDVCGFDSEGLLTDKFLKAVTFGVKSTDPSYVGGDTWGNDEAIGRKPEKSDFEEVEKYDEALSAFKDILEEARQKVDRVAYSGKVPVNISSGKVGDWVVPIDNGSDGIEGKAVTSPTIAEYRNAVGQIRSVKDDVYTLAVKVG